MLVYSVTTFFFLSFEFEQISSDKSLQYVSVGVVRRLDVHVLTDLLSPFLPTSLAHWYTNTTAIISSRKIAAHYNHHFFEFRLSSTRGHPYKLFKHHCSNTTRSVFFAERAINAWNSLPSDTVDFSTFKSFKRSIQTMDLSGYCIGSI